MTQRPPPEEPPDEGPIIGASRSEVANLASVIIVDRREDIAGICGRVDAAPTFAIVLHAPDGNRPLSTELGMRRLQRHMQESGKIVAIATANVALASRARQMGIPVARRPEHVRWDSGGSRVVRIFGRTVKTPAVGRYVQAGVILAVAATFAGLAATMAPSASVTAYPPTETLSKVITVTASTDFTSIDFAKLQVPANNVTATQHFTLAQKTTGTVLVGTAPATVNVTLTNPTGTDVAVPAHTVLLAGAAFIPFDLDAATVVPAGKSITAAATAQLPGVAGNVPAASITGWLDPAFRTLKATNSAAAAGGTSENRPGVAQADVAAIESLARSLETSATVKRTLTSARPHDAIFLGTATATATFGAPSPAVGQPADVVLLDVDVKMTALAILEGTLDQVARSVLKANQGAGDFIPGSVSAIETGARQVDTSKGIVTTELRLQGEFARNVTAAVIRSAVEGKSVADARSTLAKRYGIQDGQVSVSPGWAPWLPRFAFRIQVNLRTRTHQSTPTSEGSNPNVSTATPTASASATATPGP